MNEGILKEATLLPGTPPPTLGEHNREGRPNFEKFRFEWPSRFCKCFSANYQLWEQWGANVYFIESYMNGTVLFFWTPMLSTANFLRCILKPIPPWWRRPHSPSEKPRQRKCPWWWWCRGYQTVSGVARGQAYDRFIETFSTLSIEGCLQKNRQSSYLGARCKSRGWCRWDLVLTSVSFPGSSCLELPTTAESSS